MFKFPDVNFTAQKSIKKIISENYDVHTGISIYPDREAYKLDIPITFRYYFITKFGLSLGKKSYTVKIPEEIKKGTNEVKLAFLAGYLEGDGSFTYYKRILNNKIFRAPRVAISTYSKILTNDLVELYTSLGYRPRYRRDRKSGEFKIEILRFDEVSKLFFDIAPYLLSEEKIKIYLDLLSQERLLEAIFIPIRKELIREYHKRLGTWSKVSDYISTEIKYPVTFYSVKNWAYGYFRPPLKISVGLCDLSQKDYFNYLPTKYGGLLFAQNKIRLNKFKKIRKTIFISDYFRLNKRI